MSTIRFLFFISMAVSFSCQVKPIAIKPDLELSLKSPQDTVSLFAEDIISTKFNERDIAISPEGDEIFYSLGNYNQSLHAIVHLFKMDTQWMPAEILPWSGMHRDIEPFISPDGNVLYFASNRPVYGDTLRKDFNIWVSKHVGELWEEPTPLDSVVNSKVDEYYPSSGKSGNLYFTANHPGNHGKEDIYVSLFLEGKFQSPAPLDSAINSSTYEFNAFVSPEEDTIIFGSFGRKDDLGGGDLYMSTKDASGKWNIAHNLGPKINSSSLDYCPFIDFPRKTFYFTSNRGPVHKTRLEKMSQFKTEADKAVNGLDNIYYVKLEALK